MVESAITSVVQDYLRAVRQAGILARYAVLFGSHVRGNARPDSDIDLLVVAPEFDGPYDRRQVDLLWALRAATDSRIEPIAVGEQVGAKMMRKPVSFPILKIARREGLEIAPATR